MSSDSHPQIPDEADTEALDRSQQAIDDAQQAAHRALGDLPGLEEAGPETETGQEEANAENPGDN